MTETLAATSGRDAAMEGSFTGQLQSTEQTAGPQS
jgi:hypothetical protein